uniref:XS domain-containing protein n=1 Tax=Salix viminalis TaxID=40686 RepID=A0A6N2L144_SALVM
MNSRGGGKPFGSGANTSLSSKGGNAVESSGPAVEQLSQGVAEMGLDSAQDDGEWEVISKTSRNRSGSSSVKPGGSQDTHTKASRNPDVIQKLGMRNSDEDEVKKESDEDEDDDALDDTDDELLSGRRSSVVPAGEAFGKWKGLNDEEKDHEIVWPPMVIVMNTRLEQDGNDKWLGMGNQELLNYFRGYAAVKARHSYGPQSHRGMSALVFESSARGHLEAERLHKHFAEQGTDRNAWDRRQVLFYHGGKRQLYGYMALKEDLDLFNRHSHVGKSKLKYEMRSYHEMVVNQIRQMTEDNQQLIYLENKVVKEQRHSKQLEEISRILNEKVRKTEEENYIVRRRTQMHHEQNKEELDFQEQFFKEQLETIHEQRGVKEEDFEKLQQDKRQLVKELNANPCNTEDYRSRVEEVEKFIELQDTEMGEYVGERDGLIEEHAEKLSAVKRRQHEEEVENRERV